MKFNVRDMASTKSLTSQKIGDINNNKRVINNNLKQDTITFTAQKDKTNKSPLQKKMDNLRNQFLEKFPLLKGFPLVIGHRGFSRIAPENTLSAFEAATKQNVDMIELDVTLSKDGKLVVIHDDDLDRTTNGKGPVVNHTLEELKNMDAGNWLNESFKDSKIPTLEEVFNKFGNKVMINVEIKEPTHPTISVVDKVVNLIQERKLAPSVVISSFNHDVLKKVHSLDKSLKIAVLTDKSLEKIDPVKLTKSLHGISFNPDSQHITKEAVDKLHEAGLLVLPWSHTPDDTPETIQKMLDIGVDGIFTNHPDIMQDKL